MLTLIAAIGKNREIGYKNRLLWDIPEDMKHFRSYTMGKTLLMGRKTYESIGSKPLPGRKCIVLTSGNIDPNGATLVTDLNGFLNQYDSAHELVVIGGESLYRQTIDIADKLVITHVDSEFTADTFFPCIDLSSWKINKELHVNGNIPIRVIEYVR